MGAITVYYDGNARSAGARSRSTAASSRSVRWTGAISPAIRTHCRANQPGLAALSLLHVRDADGALHVGLPAHLVLWERLPVLHWLAAGLRRTCSRDACSSVPTSRSRRAAPPALRRARGGRA